MAEDSEPDTLLIREALSAAGIPLDRLQVAGDGEKAIGLFDQLGAEAASDCPDLVLLDINLPKKKGRDILRHIRQSSRCASTKVLVVTSSNLDSDREEMTRLGANGYFLKPFDYTAFMQLGPLVRRILGLDAMTADRGNA